MTRDDDFSSAGGYGNDTGGTIGAIFGAAATAFKSTQDADRAKAEAKKKKGATTLLVLGGGALLVVMLVVLFAGRRSA